MALTPEQIAQIQAAKDAAEAASAAGASVTRIKRELMDLTKEELDYFQTLTSAYDTQINSLNRQREQQEKILELEVQRNERAAKFARDSFEAADNELKTQQAKLDLVEAQYKLGKASLEDLKKAQDEYDKIKDKIGEAKEMAQGLSDAFTDLLKGNFTSGLKKIGSSLTKNLRKELMDKFTESIHSLVRAGPMGAAALGGLVAAFIAIGAAVAVTIKIVKMAIAVVDASNAFQKATGTSNEFASSLVTVGNDARKFGGTVQEVSASFHTLFENVSEFTMMSRASREELIRTNTVLSKLGVANDSLTKSQESMIKAMGQSAVQAAKTSRELTAFAMDIGVAPSKMMADLAGATPQLAKFGREGVKAFKDLAQTAKLTGIEVSRLLAITEKFDTFEGAAEQAGRLNAALGGNFVNAMELLTETDPTKRFEMMTSAIKDAGKSFDDMTYFEAKFFTEAMGLQDVNELALALSGNMDKVGKFTKKSSAEYERLAERAVKVQSFQEKMNTLMAQLIPIVEPIVDLLMSLSDWMSENMSIVKGAFVAMIGLLTALAIVLGVVAIKALLAASPFLLIAFAVAAAVAAMVALSDALFEPSSPRLIPEGMPMAASAATNVGDAFEASTVKMKNHNDAIKQTSAAYSAAPTAANSYAMSQVGDTITTNNNGSPLEQVINVQIGDETVQRVVQKGMGQMTRRAAVGG